MAERRFTATWPRPPSVSDWADVGELALLARVLEAAGEQGWEVEGPIGEAGRFGWYARRDDEGIERSLALTQSLEGLGDEVPARVTWRLEIYEQPPWPGRERAERQLKGVLLSLALLAAAASWLVRGPTPPELPRLLARLLTAIVVGSIVLVGGMILTPARWIDRAAGPEPAPTPLFAEQVERLRAALAAAGFTDVSEPS
jgi:hypothetical protein